MQFVFYGSRKLQRGIKPENIVIEKPKEKTLSYRAGEPRTIDTGIRGLAIAVMMQAWMDANYWGDTTTRRQSRMFLTGQTEEWRESLELWCGVCNKSARGVMDKARKLYWSKEKIEKYRKLGI